MQHQFEILKEITVFQQVESMACSLPRGMDPGNSLEISIMGSSILNPPTKSAAQIQYALT